MVQIYLNVPSEREIPRRRIERALRQLLDRVETHPVGEAPEAELSVTFLEDEPMRKLNREYRRKDRTTDVLSFSLHGSSPIGHDASGAVSPFLGDVYVGIDQAARQAEEHGVSLEEELVRLSVHGALHVLGFDHPDDAEDRRASEHWQIQEEIVRDAMAGEGAEG